MRGVSMKTKLLGTALALGLAASPIAAVAGGVGGGNANSDWTIYGWQNYSYEFVDNGDRDFDRINGNAANIGFAASLDTGMSLGGQAVKVNLQCEQFTFHNRLTSSGWCNRNSKISLSGAFGEFMFGQWLLPYNEMVAGWVDPFYDAGADSHTSIMGNVGYGGTFYNGGTFPGTGEGFDFDYNGTFALAFNRRQEEVIQYWSPNINGLKFRFAMTSGVNDETGPGGDLDPRIWSTGVAYENTLSNGDNLWMAVTYEQHDDYTAQQLNLPAFGAGAGATDTENTEQSNGTFGLSTATAPADCTDSDDTSWRVAARYIHQWGGGMSTQISAMYEDLEYENDCVVDNRWADLERDAWMVSGKQTFGNGFDFRFSYMDADEFECGGTGTACVEDDSDATAFNLGIFYTMPAGTELRVTYSEVDNEDNANYDFGIGGSSNAMGEDIDMVAFGIVQWF